ncbi:MAG: DNA gyrase inhibitor YacG [Pseudomonadota bacterium]
MTQTKPCPVCGTPVSTAASGDAVAPFKPFCSARCKDVDLNRWLSGSYFIPGRDEDLSDTTALDADANRSHFRDDAAMDASSIAAKTQH